MSPLDLTTSGPGAALAEIPGPRGSVLFGDALRFRRDLLGHLTRGMFEYGDIVRYNLGPSGTPMRLRIVALHHPDDVHTVLTRTERSFTKDTIAFRAMSEMFGRGLLTAEGDDWRRQRRLVQPLFTPRRVAGYTALMAREATLVAEDAPTDGQTVDLHLLMMRYTLRVVGRALFGDDIEDLVPVLDELVPAVSSLTRRRIMRPVRVPLRYPTPGNRHARALHDRQYAVIDEVLARARPTAGPADDAGRDDLVTRLRAARDPATGIPLSEAEIRDQALIFLMAGHETTASALTFTLHLLGRHQQIQDDVAGEVREVIADADVATAEQLGRLTLARAALLEGMRLFPSAHVTERCTAEDVVLCGHRVPAGTIVLVAPWTTHRHPDFWPDAELFDPGRFLNGQPRPRYAYFPFGGGPRSCVGEHFALQEAVVLLAALLRRRRVVAGRADVPVTPNITLRPVGQVPVTFSRR